MLNMVNNFKFDIDGTYTIPEHNSGRIDKICVEIYGSIIYYRPLCVCNSITSPYISRSVIRPVDSDNGSDWTSYYDIYNGIYTQLYAGRLLLIPTEESAVKFLSLFGKV